MQLNGIYCCVISVLIQLLHGYFIRSTTPRHCHVKQNRNDPILLNSGQALAPAEPNVALASHVLSRLYSSTEAQLQLNLTTQHFIHIWIHILDQPFFPEITQTILWFGCFEIYQEGSCQEQVHSFHGIHTQFPKQDLK